jgi:crotonobetainyl-CoA:carnitine CoA-transferase CaiB-like acyl-CoA transferase
VTEQLLAGIRVLELAQEIAGPYGGKLLADLGADVIKAEPPGGDPCRSRGPFPGSGPHPQRSGLFLYLNAGKQGIVVDLEDTAGRRTVLDLCAQVDIVLESFPPGEMERLGLGRQALQTANPRLVLVSVTPFGRTGPRSAWRGNDLIAFHSSGMAYGFPSHQVDAPELPPLNAPSYAAAFLAGEMAAGAAMHGLLIAQGSGRGCHLDLSLQEAVAAENQSQFSAFERSGSVRRTFSTAPSNPTVALLPCRDGWVAISPREEHQWTRWLAVMGNPPWAAEPRFADRRARERHWGELYPLLAAWSGQRTKAEVFEASQAARVACYPLGSATDLLESPQLIDRGFFVEAPSLESGSITVPGVPYKLAGSDGGSRRPAAGSGDSAATDPQLPVANGRRPLSGVRVVDFSWVLTGPICTKYLAALGAEVIKVESRARPDLSQRDVAWEELNPSKRSITLNLQHERARELARRLIAMSDVVVENFSTGVMERLGLDYATLRSLNPRIIMASSSALGRTGPERERVAYGTLIQCFTGWAGLAAHPGLPPRSAAGIWTDPLTATMETFLLLAAIWRQRERGAGCCFDLSMAETTIAALPEPILAWTMNHEIVLPRGNRDPLYAPQGCYPAAGDDRWVALSVRDDGEWAALCRAMGRDDLLADPRFSTASGRRERHDALDAAITQWTRRRPADAIAAQLQALGIAATPTFTVADVLADEHLAARAFLSQVESLAGGVRRTLGFPWLVDGERPGQFRRPPLVGEDNEYVFKELLKIGDEEYAALVSEEIIY